MVHWFNDYNILLFLNNRSPKLISVQMFVGTAVLSHSYIRICKFSTAFVSNNARFHCMIRNYMANMIDLKTVEELQHS